MKTLTIEEEFTRLCNDTFPSATSKSGNSLTFRRRKEYQNFFFLGFRAAIGAVMMGSDGNEEDYQKMMDSKCSELEKFFGSEIQAEVNPSTIEVID